MNSKALIRQSILISFFGILLSTLLISCKKDDINPLITNLQGTWIVDKIDGKQSFTNELIVYKIEPNSVLTECYWDSNNTIDSQWIINNMQYTVAKNTFTLKYAQHNREFEFKIEQPNENEIFWLLVKSNNNGEISYPNITYHLSRLTQDYSALILGTWEGKSITPGQDQSTHRWQYLPNGTYLYFTQSPDGTWKSKEDNTGTYILYGNILVTSWYDHDLSGVLRAYCELWNTTIQENKMSWMGIRENNSIREFALTKVSN